MELDRLYARGSGGKILEWVVQVNDRYLDSADLHTYSGNLSGRLTDSEVVFSKGKNLGKSNETSPYEQACLEAQSRWNNKKREGYKSLKDLGYDYFKDKSTVELENLLNDKLPKYNTDLDDKAKPMKCQSYLKDNGKPRIKFPCTGQPKINGIRAFFSDDKFYSKKGLNYDLMNHLSEPLSKLNLPDNYILDGELYIPNQTVGDIRSAVLTRSLLTATVQYHIFDLAIEDIRQHERIEMLKIIFKDIFIQNIVLVEDYLILSDSHAQILCNYSISKGYEGAIFRDNSAMYQFGKRPSTIVKLKRVMDGEFKILDVIDTDKEPELAMFVCKNDLNNETFKVVPQGNNELRKKMFKDKDLLIGKDLTVEYRERTAKPKELPFHGVGITIRDYE